MIFGIITLNGCEKERDQKIELIINGTVESGSLMPDGWWFGRGHANFNVFWTDQVSLSPSRSLGISTQVADSLQFAYWGQTISDNIPVGENVTLKVKIKVNNVMGRGLSIAIRGDITNSPSGGSEQFVTSQYATRISGTFDWKEYSIRMSNIKASIQSLTVYLIFLPNTTGEAYFDNISLYY
jgi:hypothetical protein